MSKGAFNGLLKGKLGNTIFYKVTNSSDKEKQGQRQYVASIANPRTAPQATQRMRMKPAINFYRGLADLLDHSWEGVKYGALSRQKFMQLALSPTLTSIPFVDKGESRFLPGAYPLSLGSVGVDTSIENIKAGVSASDPSEAHLSSIQFLDDYAPDVTWGQWSQFAIDNSNRQLRDGDEITFIAVYKNGEFYVPMHTYIVLDVQSSLTAPQVLVNTNVLPYDNSFRFVTNGMINGSGAFEFNTIELPMVAAGVIVSRHPSRTSTTWLRSTSQMFISETFKATWMSADRFAAALATYQNAASELTSDWLLNQADSPVVGGGSGGGGLIQNFTLEMRSVTPISGGSAVQLAYYNDGAIEGFICNSAVLSELEPPRIVVDTPYTLSDNSLTAAATLGVAVGTKVIGLNEYPSIRTKIAQFYTFA